MLKRHRWPFPREVQRAYSSARGWDPDSVTLPSPIHDLLESMYAGEPQLGTDGVKHPLDGVTRIKPGTGRFLHHLHAETRPDVSLEVGLAYGFSTLHILAAMQAGGYGLHTACDPFQTEHWQGIGLQKVRESGMEDRFRFLEEPSAVALPRLEGEGVRAQWIFIDGNHTFDGVLVDFCLADRLCDVGGLVIFDDLWMPSIIRVLSWVVRNRPDYTVMPCPFRNMAVFRKVAEDRRSWDHYVKF